MARDTAAKVNSEEMRKPEISETLQHFWLMPLYTHALLFNGVVFSWNLSRPRGIDVAMAK